ncbi:hypothetical protein [Pedobacter jamesrossensis]
MMIIKIKRVFIPGALKINTLSGAKKINIDLQYVKSMAMFR